MGLRGRKGRRRPERRWESRELLFLCLPANSGFGLTLQPRLILSSHTTSSAATRVARCPAST